MTIKLNTLERWQLLPEGQGIALVGKRGRKVRIEFNSEVQRRLYITRASGELRFLTVLRAGHNSLEFVEDGRFVLIPENTVQGELWAYTSEFEPAHAVVDDPVVFTKIAHRRSRNPELEQMMFLMQQNIDRRLAAADAEHSRQLALMERKMSNGLHGGKASQHKKLDGEQAGSSRSNGSEKRAGNAAGSAKRDENGSSGSGSEVANLVGSESDASGDSSPATEAE